MHVAQLWRYPVKSMAGESLDVAELTLQGVAGDRIVQVFEPHGRIVTARTRPRLLAHRVVLGPEGEPLVDGRRWDSAEVARDVEAAAGAGTRLARTQTPGRFDVLPLLVATDGAIEAFGHDGRRLRPNLVVGGVPGLAEREWEGLALRAGEAIIGIQDLRGRCVMTTFHPETLEQDVGVLRKIQRDFDGTLALNCRVLRPGRVKVGDPVELVRDLATI